jgi:hypothetical protein
MPIEDLRKKFMRKGRKRPWEDKLKPKGAAEWNMSVEPLIVPVPPGPVDKMPRRGRDEGLKKRKTLITAEAKRSTKASPACTTKDLERGYKDMGKI